VTFPKGYCCDRKLIRCSKSQVAIEYCYRFKEANPSAHVFWVYGGNIARFYQGYKRIAQTLTLPSWDDPETSILDLVSRWFAETTTTFLMVLDNADNVKHYWPGKYQLGDTVDDPPTNLSEYLPESKNDHFLLVTTRDTRVATRLAKEGKPIAVQTMSKEEATQLFLSKVDASLLEDDKGHIDGLLNELDYLPLAISQAAAFIEENCISISDYLTALRGDDAEEFLHEELNDSRRDEQSINSVFRTWKLSFDLISQQKARAAEVLCLLAMLDRQSIPRSILKVPEVVTSLGTLQAFNLITARAGSQSYGMHRLVQRFIQLSLKRSGTAQKWKDQALACVSKAYPTEIGVAEWPLCDALAPHVQIVSRYEYTSVPARLDLAHLLCWAADFDIERGMCEQALRRAHRSFLIFKELVPEDDERLAAATWLYGRLQYYEAKSEDDINAATETLKRALQISKYPSLNYAESAFELAHLYYDQRNEKGSLEMGKASFECWKAMEGPNSVRTLDNMEDYAVELAMFGHDEEAIAYWQKIIELCPASDASENTKVIFNYRSMASISEFQGDASMAEILYAKLISLGEEVYNPEHIHVLEYRICHAEQVMRQRRLKEAIQLGRAILATCKNSSGWQITASCFQLIAECNREQRNFGEAEVYRSKLLELLSKILGRGHQETIDALEACATDFMSNHQPQRAEPLYQEIVNLREALLGPVHADTLRALEWYGICLARQARDAEAEAKYLEVISRQEDTSPHLLENLCASLWNQGKWNELESRYRQALEIEGYDHASAQRGLIVALEQQGKMEEALELRTKSLDIEATSHNLVVSRQESKDLPTRASGHRFGRMIHPRTWSA
jgi:tetratricopeptide (TPR) repeat protein